MPNAVIKLENVSWTYERAQKAALDNISLTIMEGECVAVLGANGSGKTTFCRLLNGIIPHSLPGKLTGTVTVDGFVTGDSTVAQLAEKVGMAFEDPQAQLFTASLYDEVAFALENMLLSPIEINERVQWALNKAGLSAFADSAPASLSGGQKQRLVIAAAFAMAAKVLVLDDPCSQLDPVGAREVLSLVSELRSRKGLTVIIAAASPSAVLGAEAAEFADKACVLKNGALAAYTAPRLVFGNHSLLADTGIQAPPVAVYARSASALDKPLPPLSVDAAALIQIKSLGYWYDPGKVILNNINLSIADNEFVIIAGQNGSGKTTLLKNISGILRPSQGTITLRGKDTRTMEIAEIAGEIGFVMQDPDRQLFEQTVYDEVAFALRKKASGIRERVEEVLGTVGLTDKRDDFPLALSRADRVKAVFAAVLAMGPKIIMLDEPIAGQDARNCRLLMEILQKLHQQGCTIIMVTHSISIAAEYAQRLVVMESGSVVHDGSPGGAFQQMVH